MIYSTNYPTKESAVERLGHRVPDIHRLQERELPNDRLSFRNESLSRQGVFQLLCINPK